jgi:hypothetical protein
MTQEDKNLLLKDLSARLPYQVVVSYKNSDTGEAYNQILDPMVYSLVQYIPNVGGLVIKPYLRPRESITKKELKEYNKIFNKSLDAWEFADWMNAHHFDYRGLIEKGLALEAPKGMYTEK